MTTETSLSLQKESVETVEPLRRKVSNGLATRAVPVVVEWGPARHRSDEMTSTAPDHLTFTD